MVGVVEGFRWALLGTDTAPAPIIIVSFFVSFGILTQRNILFPPNGKNICGYHLGQRMSDNAIRVEDLSKKYHIGSRHKRYTRLGDQVADAVLSPFRRAGNLLRGKSTALQTWMRSFGH
jgi:hypothetical protein